MGGGLMQLVAYGAQDVYLTGNPQITFFKVVYRRHTNFAMEAIVQTFEGKFDFGRKCSCTLARNGDLVHRVYVEVDYTNAGQLSANVNGFALLEEVELEIGGQLIDRHYGEWMSIWCELTHSDSKKQQLDKLVAGAKSKNYIPLQFSFCRNPGLAIPLIALQYHEVKLNFRVATKADVGSPNGEITSACLYADYIYLDSDERRRFAQTSHEYLIEQTQASRGNPVSCANNKYELNFNHPVKELVWVHEDTDAAVLNYKNNVTVSALLKLNGHDRFRKRTGDYFRNVQRYQHHTGAEKNQIHVYSFALQPEEHQPSGTCNFSRIDNAILEVNTGAAKPGANTNIYAMNYNVLRVMSGMGGLAYSN